MEAICLVRYAILSDVHSRLEKLKAVLADARQRSADRFVSLGDVGSDACLAWLQSAGALAVFGNYEVSGWRHLSPRHRAWVQSWPPLLAEDDLLAVHAAPWWPEGLSNVQDFGTWLKQTGRGWRALFPYLTEEGDHLWRAVAGLEAAGRTVLFHGHTHVQAIWCWRPPGRLAKVDAARVRIEAEHFYLVGVGSVGLPEDGAWAAYSLYDAEAGEIEQIRLERQ
jgi:hypothetical protein